MTYQSAKVKKGISLYMLGKRITIDMVFSLTNRDLVWKFEFVKLTRMDIMEWICLKWEPIIKTVPRVLMLMNRCIWFQFISEEDRKNIEEQFWVIEKGSLVHMRWNSRFKPWKEKLRKRHLYVMLQGFPQHCWNLADFVVVANLIGKFILIEED